jgi:hypothetical protein
VQYRILKTTNRTPRNIVNHSEGQAMKKIIYSTCIVLFYLLSGCNDDTRAAGPREVAAGPEEAAGPPAPPPPNPRINCGTLSLAKTSDIDALPGGIWHGELVYCDDSPRFNFVTALVTEDGLFRIDAGDHHLLSGSLRMDGDTFNGHGVDFAGAGTEYFSGPTTSLFVQGSVKERSELDGRWGTEWGSFGYFSFYYGEDAYEKPSTLEALAGVWPSIYNDYINPIDSVDGTWTIEPDGQFNGQDEKGCLHSGQFALIDDRFSLLEVELTILGCDLAGYYTGLAYREELVDWWDKAITLSVDDGQRALRIILLM